MVPNMANFSGMSGQPLTCGIGTPVVPSSSADCLELFKTASVTGGTGVTISESGGGDGVWIPYVPQKATYGYAGGGAQWMGTGPFSGCHIAFFSKEGRVGMAHIAKESGTSASTDAWKTFTKSGGIMVLNEWKVSMPDQTAFSASYVFLDLSNPASVALMRVDVHVRGMGGSDGTIFGVSKIL